MKEIFTTHERNMNPHTYSRFLKTRIKCQQHSRAAQSWSLVHTPEMDPKQSAKLCLRVYLSEWNIENDLGILKDWN
jgi:hypothetical protein